MSVWAMPMLSLAAARAIYTRRLMARRAAACDLSGNNCSPLWLVHALLCNLRRHCASQLNRMARRLRRITLSTFHQPDHFDSKFTHNRVGAHYANNLLRFILPQPNGESDMRPEWLGNKLRVNILAHILQRGEESIAEIAE